MRAEDVGWPANKLVLGKHSGRHAIFHRTQALGIHLTNEQKERFFEQFKKLADEKKEIFDEDLYILGDAVASAGAQQRTVYRVKNWHVETGSSSPAHVVIELEKSGEVFKKEMSAHGPVDAAYKAINEIAGAAYVLEYYDIAAVTRGEDAFGEVTVKLREKERVFGGKGVSQNIIEASILAYVDAVNKCMMLIDADDLGEYEVVFDADRDNGGEDII
jgi:2-isopropylmalate synthase